MRPVEVLVLQMSPAIQVLMPVLHEVVGNGWGVFVGLQVAAHREVAWSLNSSLVAHFPKSSVPERPLEQL